MRRAMDGRLKILSSEYVAAAVRCPDDRLQDENVWQGGGQGRDGQAALERPGHQLGHSRVRDIHRQPFGGRRARLQPGVPVLQERRERQLFSGDCGIYTDTGAD